MGGRWMELAHQSVVSLKSTIGISYWECVVSTGLLTRNQSPPISLQWTSGRVPAILEVLQAGSWWGWWTPLTVFTQCIQQLTDSWSKSSLIWPSLFKNNTVLLKRCHEVLWQIPGCGSSDDILASIECGPKVLRKWNWINSGL